MVILCEVFKFYNLSIFNLKGLIRLRDLDCFNIKKGYYQISDDGMIWSIVSNKFIAQKRDSDGYHDVLLVCEDGKRHHFRVHRLVAMVYLGNPKNLPVVMHLDNNKSNNHISNLKWGTVQENTQQAYIDGCCSCNKPVFLYDRYSKKLIKEFISIGELVRYFDFEEGYVTGLGKICSGKKPQPIRGKLKDYIITHERL